MADNKISGLFGPQLADNRALAAEFVATTLFVFTGCGVAVSTQGITTQLGTTLDSAFVVAVALAFGFAIAVLAYTIAPISGGHINPAVTFAFLVLGEFNLIQFVQYLVAQCAGAVLGASLVWGTYSNDMVANPPFNLGSNFVNQNYSNGAGFLGEMMGTIILVWTVLMTAVSSKSIAGNLAPIAIGWSVMLAHLLLVPITGCGINPARTFGPHFVSVCAGVKVGKQGWWVYYTAPFLGAAIAALLAHHVFDVLKPETTSDSKAQSAPAAEKQDKLDDAAADEEPAKAEQTV